MGFSSTNRPTPFLTNPLSDFRFHHPGVRRALHAKAPLALQEFTFTLLCWPGLTPPLPKHKYCHILVNTQQQFPAGVLNATTAPPRVPSHLPRTEQLKGQHLAEQAHRTRLRPGSEHHLGQRGCRLQENCLLAAPPQQSSSLNSPSHLSLSQPHNHSPSAKRQLPILQVSGLKQALQVDGKHLRPRGSPRGSPRLPAPALQHICFPKSRCLFFFFFTVL